MSLNHGGKIATSGLVLMLDSANIKSFPGTPGTNLFGANVFYQGTSTDPNFTTSIGTETVNIPAIGNVSVNYVTMYNNYPTSANCCPQLFHWDCNAVVGSTLYTYCIVYKSENGYTHPNYMYRYEFNGGTYVTETGVFNTSNRTDLGNGWYYAWGEFTTNASTNNLSCSMFHYQYNTYDKVSVYRANLTQGSLNRTANQLLTPYEVRGTTAATGGGWKDLSGNNNHATVYGTIPFGLDITYCFDFATITGTYSGDASLGFLFGSNMITTTGNFTFSCWIKNPNSTNSGVGLFSNAGGGDGYRFGVGRDGIYYLIGPTYQEGSVSFLSTLSTSVWYNVTAIFLRSSSFVLLYLNGVYQGQVSISSTQTAFSANTPGIVRSPCCGIYTGKLSTFLAYNKALSATEILQNFNATKSRYGLS